MANENQMSSGTSLDAIASLLKMFAGTQTKSSGGTETQTTQSGVDEAGMATLLKTALESNSGLAAVTQGQKAAGLFNSSTNRLMTNDLLSRLTAQAALAGADKTTTTVRTPSVQTQSIGSQDMLAKLAGGLTAYQKIAKPAMSSKLGKQATGFAGDVVDAGAYAAGGGSVPFADLLSANSAADPIAALNMSQGWTDITGGQQAVADAVGSDVWNSFDAATNEFMNYMSQGAQSADAGASVVDSGAGAATDAIPAEDTTNFTTASLNNSQTGGAPSSSEILSEANSTADTTSVVGSLGGSAVTASQGLGTAASGISYGASTPASLGSLDTGYNLGSGLTEAGGSTDALAGTAGTGDAASSTGGSILGYIGPIMSAFGAQNNPKGAQNADYRHAVGGAVLNYFGFGWASPIVHAVAEPALNASMEAGTESMGTFGAVLADPVGAPLSGQYEVGDLISSTLDPANIFGGNPGGSTGALVAATVDPIGAALGDEGLFSVVKDGVNSLISADPIASTVGDLFGGGGGGGKVICTEMAMQDRISPELYSIAISPKHTMTGRVLAGYHVWGVAAVRMLRTNPKLSEWLAPYVIKYIEHKAGKRNWQGFWIKTIMHPICWVLSFFNTNPTAYRNLYRRERKA